MDHDPGAYPAAIPLLTEKDEELLFSLRGSACFFTGHRDIPPQHQQPLAELLEREIGALIYQGFTVFLSGAARGFDLMAAAAVLFHRRSHPDVRLILAVPCPEQSKGWTREEQQLYNMILSRGEPYLLSAVYEKDSMQKRNRFMVDHAIMGVAYCLEDRPHTGTAQTIRYAEKCRIPYLNLAGFPELSDGPADRNKA